MTVTDVSERAAAGAASTTSAVGEAQPGRKRRMAREPQQAAALTLTGDADIAPPASAVPAPPRSTKAAAVEALLRREGGATLDELCKGTGWQAHTCRAFLTGLRKKGHALVKAKSVDGPTRWSIAACEAG